MTSASAEQTLFTLEGFDQQAAASVATPAATGVNKLSAIQTGIRSRCFKSLAEDLSAFHEFGQATRQLETRFETGAGQFREVPTFLNEFWTARQRQARIRSKK